MFAKYEPSDERPWNVRRVAHLHRRAGFAATWSEIQRDLSEGPQAAVDRLLAAETRIDGVREDFAHMADVIGSSAVGSGNASRLKAWWLYRMLVTPDPLTERLTLMWHNHFATSNVKINDVGPMKRQNEIFRDSARASFAELLHHAVTDPALLIWLDADANRKEHANENLAREIMELFALGVGNYTEADIRDAARALTGWSVRRGEFHVVDEHHDPGDKTIFGRTGPWNGDDLVRLLLEHPACARRIAFRICELFFGEDIPTESLISDLADDLRSHHLNVGRAVERVLRSEEFFDDTNIGNRVSSPVEQLVGTVRSLEMTDPLPSTLLLAEWSARLGQDLFYPPNVFGWPGGRSWLTSRAIVGRANFASAVTAGQLHNPVAPLDAPALAAEHDIRDPNEMRSFFAALLLGNPDSPQLPAESPTHYVTHMLASPEAQLN